MKRKEKFIYPDWSRTAGQIVTRGDEKGTKQRPVWKPYDWDSADNTKVMHSLYATLEVAGATYPFGEKFGSEEECEAFRIQNNREVTWLRALGFAEMLWRDAPHHEYVVLFRPVSQDNDRETVCIYRLLHIPEVYGE